MERGVLSTVDQTRTGLAVAAALGLLAGCSYDAGAQDPATTCQMQIQVVPSAEIGQRVMVAGVVNLLQGEFGPERLTWTVLHQSGAGVPFEVSPDAPDQIQFVPEQPGEHLIGLSGDIDGAACAADNEIVTVRDPSAVPVAYRLQVLPRASHEAVRREVEVILRGVDESQPDIALSRGVVVAGTITSGGAPVAGYVRATSAAGGVGVIEGFADAQGQFSIRLPDQPQDVLFVPQAAGIAPIALLGRTPAQLTGGLALPADDAVSGSVLDPAGVPVIGARVTLHVDGVASTIGVTDAAGAFTVRARPPASGAAQGLVTVDVTPPAGAGLPRLSTAPVMRAPPSAMAIQYAPELISRAVTIPIVLADGATPAPDARVSWISRPIPAAGAIALDGGAPIAATGSSRVIATTDAAGVMSAVVAAWFYDAVIEPAGGPQGGVALTEVDLSAGEPTPALLATASAARLIGRATAADGAPLAGVRVSVIPRGVLALAAQAGPGAVTGQDGGFSLEVIGGGDYELSFDSSNLGHGRALLAWTAPAAGVTDELGDVALPVALRVTGRVVVPSAPGGPAPDPRGIALAIYRAQDEDGAQAAGEAVTGVGGVFTLRVSYP